MRSEEYIAVIAFSIEKGPEMFAKLSITKKSTWLIYLNELAQELKPEFTNWTLEMLIEDFGYWAKKIYFWTRPNFGSEVVIGVTTIHKCSAKHHYFRTEGLYGGGYEMPASSDLFSSSMGFGRRFQILDKQLFFGRGLILAQSLLVE